MAEQDRGGTDAGAPRETEARDPAEVHRGEEHVAEEASGAGENGREMVEEDEAEELRRRFKARGRHLQELYDEITAVRVAADEAWAREAAARERLRGLEEERDRLRERVREYEEEERRRRRRREGQDRRVARLGRELERRDAEIERLETVIEERQGALKTHEGEFQDLISRKDAALKEALRRIEGLERDLEEREADFADVQITMDRLRAELDLEYELRRRMAEPENRLRAGIDLFNDSEHLRSVGSISRSLGPPEVHVALDDVEVDEPPVVLTFTWQGITWQTYHSNPGLAVEEPRVYQTSGGEDLSGVEREPPNARIGPGGRVVLGL